MDDLSFVCNCETNPVLICKNHISDHSQLARTHRFVNISSSINQETKIPIIKLFSRVKSKIKQFKLKVIFEESSIIQKLHKTVENTLEKLKIYDQKLTKIISDICSLSVIDNTKPLSFIETLLSNDKSIIKEIRYPKLHINEIDTNSITEMFNLEPADKTFDYSDYYRPTPQVIKFVCNGKRNKIAIFDPSTLKINKINYIWKKTLNFGGVGCLLPNGNLFYNYKDSWLIINPIGKVKKIPAYKWSNTAGATYVDGKIYMFGGSDDSAAKFIIDQNRWSSFGKSSISIEFHTTCTLFKNKILIASKSGNPIYYDIIADSYFNLLFHLQSGHKMH